MSSSGGEVCLVVDGDIGVCVLVVCFVIFVVVFMLVFVNCI